MKLFIDFDDVIFNAKRFKNDLIRVFLRNGITRQEFDNSYYTFQKRAQELGHFYDPKKQILVLKKKYQIDHEKLAQDIDQLMGDLHPYVFSDVSYFLDQFIKKDLYIITYGHEKHQLKKIKGANVDKLVNKVLITKNNKIDVILKMSQECKFSPDERIVLIDDRPEQLERSEAVKKSITTFRICRSQGRYSDLLCMDKDFEVKNLREVLRIMKKEKMM